MIPSRGRCWCGLRPVPVGLWDLWRRGHAEMLAAEESGRYPSAPTVYASGVGRTSVRGEPVRDGWLRFTFRDGDAAYPMLASAPELGAIVTGLSSVRYFGIVHGNSPGWSAAHESPLHVEFGSTGGPHYGERSSHQYSRVNMYTKKMDPTTATRANTTRAATMTRPPLAATVCQTRSFVVTAAS
jgi:hypothetical protein